MSWICPVCNIFPRLLLVCFLLSCLSGCATSGGKSNWASTIQTYDHACQSVIIMEPICLISANSDGGFKYSEQFQACKQSVLNYTNALDDFYRCSDTKLKAIFDELLVSVPATYNCYVKFFNDKKEGDPIEVCPPVDVPRFIHSYEAKGLEHNLGVPLCVAKNKAYNFAPQRTSSLDDCREQVEVFAGNPMKTYSSNAASAQTQYDTYMHNLRRVQDQKAADVINRFKCIAERRPYCM